jgi:hypothetical protein
VVNLKEYVAPCARVPLVKALLRSVAVCGAESLFVHCTVPPAFTVTDAGEKAKPAMLTLASAAGALGSVGFVGGGVLLLSDFEQAAIPTTTTAIINDIPKMYFFMLKWFKCLLGLRRLWCYGCFTLNKFLSYIISINSFQTLQKAILTKL